LNTNHNGSHEVKIIDKSGLLDEAGGVQNQN
jgi:hypothetical protein